MSANGHKPKSNSITVAVDVVDGNTALLGFQEGGLTLSVKMNQAGIRSLATMLEQIAHEMDHRLLHPAGFTPPPAAHS